MNKAEAELEARNRWGKSGFVHKAKSVYEVCGGWYLEHYGSGSSWEAAFEDADRRADAAR